jgi:hypothetical protein
MLSHIISYTKKHYLERLKREKDNAAYEQYNITA